jgi:hypothetical protein
MEMTDYQIRQHIDWLIQAQTRLKRYYEMVESDSENGIEFSGVPEFTIHVYKGIEKIASALNCDLSIITDRDEKYPFEYFFKYRGYKIFQISEAPL